MMQYLALFVVIVGYGVAILMIARIFMIALTMHTEVPYVPSGRVFVKKALEVMELEDGQRVVDLGSGDGKFVIYAARKYPNVYFTGVELNPGLVRYSRLIAKLRGLKNVEIIEGDVFEYDVSPFDKIYLYLTGGFVSRLMEVIKDDVKVGAVVISSHFGFGKEFESNHDIEEREVRRLIRADRVSIWTKV